MKAAIDRILRQMPMRPGRLFSDKGLEFTAGPVKKHLRELYIEKHEAESPDVKASVAEKFINTLKTRLWRYFSLNDTDRWIDVLPKIVNAINRSVSSATGVRPIDVTVEN